MELRKVFIAIRRYWFVVVGVLILTAVAIALVPYNISADYEANGSVLLLSPSTIEDSVTGESVGINPWSRFGASGEGVAATAIIEVLQSGEFENEVMDDPAIKEFRVAVNPGGNGAIIDITVTATEPESAVAAFDLIVDRIISELESRQEAAGAPVETRLSADVLTRPGEATELLGSRSRAMLALGVLGLVASVAAAVGLDTLRSSREDRTDRDPRREASPTAIHEAEEAGDDESDASSSTDDAVGDENRDEGHERSSAHAVALATPFPSRRSGSRA